MSVAHLMSSILDHQCLVLKCVDVRVQRATPAAVRMPLVCAVRACEQSSRTTDPRHVSSSLGL